MAMRAAVTSGVREMNVVDVPEPDEPGSGEVVIRPEAVGICGSDFHFLLGEDKTGSAPAEDPVHPTEILATIYHAMAIDPQTIVYNHLNQPRELVKAEMVERLFS
jgi:threonine dehydrogenase-like Zn-dependent dehydrogenase